MITNHLVGSPYSGQAGDPASRLLRLSGCGSGGESGDLLKRRLAGRPPRYERVLRLLRRLVGPRPEVAVIALSYRRMFAASSGVPILARSPRREPIWEPATYGIGLLQATAGKSSAS